MKGFGYIALASTFLYLGCASVTGYFSIQDKIAGKVTSSTSLDGKMFYENMLKAIEAEHPWDTGEFINLGQPDLIYSASINNCYFLFKEPLKIIHIDIPIVGKIKFVELDYTPDEFLEYLQLEGTSHLSLEQESSAQSPFIGMELSEWLKSNSDAYLLYMDKDSVCYGSSLLQYVFIDDKLVKVQSMLVKE